MSLEIRLGVESVIDTFFPDDPYPRNPLLVKWSEKYPSIPKPEYSQVCDGYSCVWCGRCPLGKYWMCPEEDIDEYRKYELELQSWLERHPKYLDQIFLEVRNDNKR